MPAPIAVELVANPAPAPDLAQVLIAACSAAAGSAGCALEGTSEMPETPAAAAHVIVIFAPGGARVRVEARSSIAPDQPEGRVASREIAFRDDDPLAERFRATGLVAADLVSELAVAPSVALSLAPSHSVPEETSEGAGRSAYPPAGVAVRVDGGVGWNAGRPWILGEVGADVTVVSPLFVALSAAYGQTAARDASGILDQRTAFAIGAGLVLPVTGPLEARFRAELVANEVKASVVQPLTRREDAGERALVGARGGVDLALSLGAGVGVLAGVRIDDLGGVTTIRVQGEPVGAVQAWLPSVALGLNVRLP